MNTPQDQTKRAGGAPAWVAYVVPMALFALFTTLEGYVEKSAYVWVYVAKVVAVTSALVIYRHTLQGLRPTMTGALLAVVVGLVTFAVWVLLDKWLPYPRLGSRTALNPFVEIGSPAIRTLFLAARFYGLVLMVPVMEEIFWRSFLLRYFTDANFTSVPLGVFSGTAFAIVAAAFAISHPEWPAALFTACAYALLLRQTKSLFACIVAHLVTNLALGIYVITTGEWQYW